QQVQQQKSEAARKRDAGQRQVEMVAVQKRQQDLARVTETARRNAEKVAVTQSVTQRRVQEEQKQKAYDDLVAQGKTASQQGQYQRSIQLLESAVALKPNDAGIQELVQARAKAEEAARIKN